MEQGRFRSLIYGVKRFVPRSVWRAVTAPYWWWYNRLRHQAAGLLDPRLRRSQARLLAMKDSHAGQRCFIIGNGPSLRKTDLSLLKDEITFGMNRIYLLFPELDFRTTFYACVNTLIIDQCAEDIKALSMPKFVTWRGREALRGDPETIFLDTDYTGEATFARGVSSRVFEGSTVTYVALQVAFHLGFQEVILIGVDHNYATKGPANVTVTSAGEDPNHFAPGYFGKGFRWQLPDLEASERAYRLARGAYEAAGRRVLDATVDGKLTVFPKVDYGSLFDRR